LKGKLIIASLLTIFRKVIFWGLAFILLSLTICISLLQTNFFQNWATQKLLGYLGEQTSLKISIGKVNIRWFDSIDLYDLDLIDYRGNSMISAKEVYIDFDLFNLVNKNQIIFDQLELVGGAMHVTQYRDSLSFNLVEFVYGLQNPDGSTPDTTSKSTQLVVHEILLEDFQFHFDHQLQDSLQIGYFDYWHFSFNVPEAEISAFRLIGDTIRANIHKLAAMDTNSGMTVNSLSGDFGISKRELFLNQMKIVTPYSELADRLLLSYNGFDDFSSFNDSVTISATLSSSYIHPKDLQYFAPINEKVPPFGFKGNIDGIVKELSIREMTIKLGDESHLAGKVDFIGLPEISETFVDLTVAHGYIRSEDVSGLIDDLSPNIKNLGALSVSGRFLGFFTDFVANTEIMTAEGRLISDMNLKFVDDWQTAEYSGSLKLVNFSAGVFLNNKALFQKLNFEGGIKGSGLLLSNADFFAEGHLTNTGINGYNYNSIKAKGHFSSQFFDGTIDIDDPNAQMSISGNIDLKSKPEIINSKAKIKKFDLYKAKLLDEPFSMSAELQLDLTGLALDSMNADMNFKSMSLQYHDKKLILDSGFVYARNKQGKRKIEFLVPDIHGKLEGSFFYSHLYQDLQGIYKELAGYFDPNIKLDSVKPIGTYDQYDLDFELEFGDLTGYMAFLNQEVFVSEGAFLSGTYYQRKNATLSLFAEVDSMNVHGTGFSQNQLDLNLSKDLDSAGLLGIINLTSEHQYWSNMPESSNLSVEAIWQNNNLVLNTVIHQKQTNSKASINANLDFLEDRLVFSFRPSNIQVLGDRWYFNPANKVQYFGESIRFDYLELSQNDQTVQLTGSYSDSTETNLELTFRKFDLANLNTVLPVTMAGQLDGDFSVKKNGVNASFEIQSLVSIVDLAMDDNFLGNMNGQSQWESDERRLFIDFEVKRRFLNSLDVKGYYYPEQEDDQLDLTMSFQEADLELLSPFFKDFVSGISGTANGKILIDGRLDAPMLNGQGEISHGSFRYDYLGVTYGVEGKVLFDNESIQFKDVLLRDKELNRANLEGKIYHKGFSNMRPDIKISTTDFIFLNTNDRHGEIYYGTVHASGNINISGSFSDLLISAKVKSEKGTKFYVSLQEDNKVNQKEYITFKDFKDSTSHTEVIKTILSELSGVRLDFDMEITPDAYVELIFDPRTGDIIKGTGDGNLNLLLDSNGEFELFGDVRIEKGSYNFTYSILGTPLISKEFSVKKGGLLSFYGDPYAGVMNIEAIYRQLASLADLNPSTGNTNPSNQISPRIPVLVVLKLQGAMLSPNIAFAIKLEDNQSNATIQENGAINDINSNEQELKRQVFSLLMFRKFSPKDQFQSSGLGFNTLSEFFSNQISYYVNQLNENLEVNVDVATNEQSTIDALQLQLSYTFLDGRLRVSGGGGFNSQSTVSSDANNAFIGDWSIRYILTADGKLLLRAFSQADQLIGVPQRETGVSIQAVKSFDGFNELFRKGKKNDSDTKN
jgi:hypothetical protein